MNQEFFVRKMTEQDLDEVMRIEHEAFSLPWSRDSYLGELKNSFADYLVCDFAGEIAGYAGIWVVFEEAHITNVAVSKKYRSRGIGLALMQETEKIARAKQAIRILLEVRPSNQVAISMYESLDYYQTGVRKAYYTDNGEDAIIMTKLLF
ncbi:Acyl-CoA N-acyltransferase [Syntrophomonas zehnderi OL-4]|uniref:[Ribosomal protein bS18]-alanine N-acetyltransferase n=1 Tax=Syntrophomonas zehnderi OL-4 TaxID=690567 RepID=A0A0E4GBF2_9FIRM|nr:Acyl-CoA N-acyltransferase [Syntrophomonas zehnderi OL-4]